MPLSEFDIIDKYFSLRQRERDDVVLGIGDDAALLRVPPGMELAVAVDSIFEGVHFPVGTDGTAVGHKALAVNLSDMAAMSAEPAWATLALSMPKADEAYVAAFAEGFFHVAETFNVQLVGGDTVRGCLGATVQVGAWVPAGAALRRSGAKPGDLVYVSGTLGDAAAGLRIVQEGQTRGLAKGDADFLVERLNRPSPRVALGMALRTIAAAAIDVSDGLAADLGHILAASHVGARLEVAALPLSEPLKRWGRDRRECHGLALGGGDDYELCFTVPPIYESRLRTAAEAVGCPVTRVGTIEKQPGLRLCDADGSLWRGVPAGYNHFAGDE